MDFRKVDSGEPVAQYIAEEINVKLSSGQKVLWLIPGGSAIEIVIKVTKFLNTELKNLTVSLTDERYGPTGHQDSNWQQLLSNGFALAGANLYPVLVNKSLEETTSDFDKFLEQQLQVNDFKVGLFGMGADGHTSGILPGSTAVSSNRFADSYTGPDYTRITTTPKAIAMLNEAIVFATGESKHLALDNLSNDLPSKVQPAQILKQVPRLIVYNDYKGDK